MSIERVWQEGSGDEATLVFITHRTQESAFQKTLQQLRDLPVVRAISSVLRVEGEDEGEVTRRGLGPVRRTSGEA